MKKKILALAMVAISLSIVAYGSLAYFTASGTAHNVITSGAVAIEVVEWMLEGDEQVPYPKEEPIKVMPGVTVSKIVTVENKDAKAFVRANFAVTVKDAEGEIMELDEATLESLILIAVNDEYWLTKEEDGWYYYKDIAGSDVATEPLFSEVTFAAKEMGNEYQNCTVEIDVNAQAVQAANNGENVLEAAGWPTN